MHKKNSRRNAIAATAAMAAGLSLAGAAQAHTDVFLGFGVAPAPVYAPPPVYVPVQPGYYGGPGYYPAPAPTYQSWAPAYGWYGSGGRWEHERHEWRHRDDDDDD